jgi:hypothetical protein
VSYSDARERSAEFVAGYKSTDLRFQIIGIGTTAALSMFAGLNMVAFVLVYLFVPETRMRTLEELQYTFDLPTRWHVQYRASYISKHVRRNWWRYLMRKQIAEDEIPIPYYEWARIVYEGDQLAT